MYGNTSRYNLFFLIFFMDSKNFGIFSILEGILFRLLISVSSDPLEQDSSIDAVLGDNVGTHGPELWLRDSHDRAANLHETSATFLYQRRK